MSHHFGIQRRLLQDGAGRLDNGIQGGACLAPLLLRQIDVGGHDLTAIERHEQRAAALAWSGLLPLVV